MTTINSLVGENVIMCYTTFDQLQPLANDDLAAAVFTDSTSS
jgi:hypothetical protein